MEKKKLKKIISDLKSVIADLESEVYSDPSKYLEQDSNFGFKVIGTNDDDGDPDWLWEPLDF